MSPWESGSRPCVGLVVHIETKFLKAGVVQWQYDSFPACHA